MTLSNSPFVRLAALLALALGGAVAATPEEVVARAHPPLTLEQAAQVGEAIAEMTRNPRGPYLRLRWFCNDGTVLPPEPFACRPHGGGHQHAQVRPEIAALTELGFSFGTVYRALDLEQLIDAGHGGYRARELVVQAYLDRADDGWVMRRARYYRGARQAEDEEWAGRELLVALLGDPEWVNGRPLLASRLVETVPHAGSGSLTADIRSLAVEIEELDTTFARLRVKLHSMPGPADIDTVAIALGQLDPGAPAELAARLQRLLTALRAQYGRQLDAERWRALAAAGGDQAARDAVETLLLSSPDAAGRVEQLSLIARASRQRVGGAAAGDGDATLALLELASRAADRAAVEAASWLEARADRDPTRRELLTLLRDLTAAAYGDGWLTRREYLAMDAAAEELLSSESITAGVYHARQQYLERAAGWAQASVRQVFDPVVGRYLQVEPRARGFEDDLLRSSVLLPLSRVMTLLAQDAAAAIGQQHDILGVAARTGVLGLNSGVAIGRLYVADSVHEVRAPDPKGIYVLPETPPEMGRVAGILTLGQGSRLSHVQLLARGLGIPNAAIDSSFLEVLRQHVGDELVYSVSPRGAVRLAHKRDDDPTLIGVLATARVRIDEALLDLDLREPVPLDALDAADAGRIAGPKAANLGQLHGLFGNRVAPGIVVPFGVFREHIEQQPPDGGPTIAAAIRQLARDPEHVPQLLQVIRERIVAMPLLPHFQRQLESMLAAKFGEPGTYGVFVRSDTNVEDLPNFSGAGLNLTVPNVVGIEPTLQAIRDVWASPFTERAYGWRSGVVENPGSIYPSLLLLGSVASEASGVLVNRDVDDVLRARGDPADYWTVTLSAGIGGGVDGEATETMLVAADGRRDPVLLSSARSPRRKVLRAAGGIEERLVDADTRLLTAARLEDLRAVVEQVGQRYPVTLDATGAPMPWDIEFGFVGDRTVLFQIRPFLVGRRGAQSNAAADLDARLASRAEVVIDLDVSVTR